MDPAFLHVLHPLWPAWNSEFPLHEKCDDFKNCFYYVLKQKLMFTIPIERSCKRRSSVTSSLWYIEVFNKILFNVKALSHMNFYQSQYN